MRECRLQLESLRQSRQAVGMMEIEKTDSHIPTATTATGMNRNPPKPVG